METQSRVGRIAAIVTAVTYAIAVVIVGIGTVVEDDNQDGSLGDWMYFSWCALVFAGTIAVAVVVYALLKKSGALSTPLGKVSLVITAIAAVGSFFTWAWPIWGTILALGALLTAIALRERGHGFVGRPSSWDWAITVGWLVGLGVMILLYVTDIVESDPDGLDWAYTSGFIIGALVTGATMILTADALKTSVPVVEEYVVAPVEPVDPTEPPPPTGY